MIVLLIVAGGSFRQAGAFTRLQERGRELAEKMCARCHAIGRSGDSPHVGAPPLRELDRRIDLDAFLDRLRGGLASSHPDMPTFRFSRDDARAMTAYVRAIQGL